MKRTAFLFATIAVAAGAYAYLQFDTAKTTDLAKASLPDGALVVVALPATLNEQETMGKRGFDAVCAACHGTNAQGRDGVAPPLVHRIYEPGHHGDMAFVLAAKNGVAAHHWPFGNMPAVEGVTDSDVLNIVAYVRALQRENGIN
ncbi:Cytochrome c [Pseudorhodobacter antarcticus]|jgi:cytochrome c|uniref:Cytochrome c n=1 Tax=Pseudorhodobacter antarcticus TaxID=1077947 RepID=A0A1H8MSW5_9RHOB|nr:cytochrome c [Pseudorhodobacter antarcticus]SEO20338.1 Cytochrome c [Pseudorhodobacter antarcticus]